MSVVPTANLSISGGGGGGGSSVGGDDDDEIWIHTCWQATAAQAT